MNTPIETKIEIDGISHTIPEPLCGSDWLQQHLRDHTHQEIESLSIKISSGNGILTFSTRNKTILKDYLKIKGDS